MQATIQAIWDQLTPQEQIRIIHILVQMVLHQLAQGEEVEDEQHG